MSSTTPIPDRKDSADEQRPAPKDPSIAEPADVPRDPTLQTRDQPEAEIVDAETMRQAEGLRARVAEGERVASEGPSLGQAGFGTVEEHSGTYSYRVEIHVPRPQNGGPVPKLGVIYNSGTTAAPSLIAAGWRLVLGHVERTARPGEFVDFRNNQGSPEAQDHFVLHLDGGSHTLVRLQGSENRHLFRAKIENGFLEAERFLHPDALDPDSGEAEIDRWEVRTANGAVYSYGVPGAAGEVEVAGQVRNKLWHLMSMTDSRGRRCDVEYELASGTSSPFEVGVSYPARVKTGMTADGEFWDGEVHFQYRDDDGPGAEGEYYFLGSAYTGREVSGEIAMMRRRLVAIESRFRDEQGRKSLSRRLRLEASLVPGRRLFRLDEISEIGYRDGAEDGSTVRPPHRFRYTAAGPDNPALLERSITPMGQVNEQTYRLAREVDPEAAGTATRQVVTRRIEAAGDERFATRYDYLGGLIFTHFGEYRGHRRVTIRDEQTGHTIEKHFHQTGVYNGSEELVITRDSRGKPLKSVRHDWVALNYLGGRFLPFSVRTVEHTYDELGERVLFSVVGEIEADGTRPWKRAIDEFGNFLSEVSTVWLGEFDPQLGPVDGATVAHQTRTLRSYENRVQDHRSRRTLRHRFVGLLTETRVFRRDRPSDEYQLAERSENRYGEHGDKIESLEYFEVGEPSRARRHTFEYHPASGMLVREVRHHGDLAEVVSQNQYFEDGPYRFLLWRSTDGAGHTAEIRTYDLQSRQPTMTLEVDGMLAETVYDGLGRSVEERYAGHVGSFVEKASGGSKDSVRRIYHITEFERSLETVNLHTGARVQEFFDPFQRSIRKLSLGFRGRRIVASQTRYDPRTRQVAEILEPHFEGQAAPGRTTFEYDERGRLTRRKDPGGGVVRREYADFRVTTIQEIRRRDRRDEKTITGDLLHEHVAEVVTRDATGRVVCRATGRSGEADRYELLTEYDAVGRATRLRDNLGTTLRRFDYGRRLDVNPVAIDDVTLGRLEMRYDDLNRLVEVRHDFKEQGGRRVSRRYDPLDRVREEVHRDTADGFEQRIETEYDTAPNGVGKLARRRLVETSFWGRFEHHESFSYDRFGLERERLTDWSVDWPELGVDRRFRLLTEMEHNGPRAGRLERLAYHRVDPDSGARQLLSQTRFQYDDFTSLPRAVEMEGTVVWRAEEMSARNQVVASRLGNGVAARFDYEAASGWLRSLEYRRGSEVLHRQSLDQDSAGRLLSRRVESRVLGDDGEEVPFAYDGAYGYDGRGQLLRAEENRLEQTFSYRADGSRLRMTTAGRETVYHYEDEDRPHRLTRVSGAMRAAISYDLAGNMIEDVRSRSGQGSSGEADGGEAESEVSSRRLLFSPANRLSGVRLSGDGPAACRLAYAYGGDGQRAASFDSRSGELQLSVGDGIDVVLRGDEVRVKSHALNVDGYRIATLDESEDGRELSYFLKDSLSSCTVVTDEAGALTSTADYEPFGRVRGRTGREMEIGFTGRRAELVGEGGFDLYDFKARFYDPGLGIFVSPDPAEDSQNAAFGFNRYVYAHNNPLSNVDPSGHWLKSLWNSTKSAVVSGFQAVANSTIGNALINSTSADLAAGFGDQLWEVPFTNFSIPREIRRGLSSLGWVGDTVNYDSGAYTGGKWAGFAWGLVGDPFALVGGALAKMYKGSVTLPRRIFEQADSLFKSHWFNRRFGGLIDDGFSVGNVADDGVEALAKKFKDLYGLDADAIRKAGRHGKELLAKGREMAYQEFRKRFDLQLKFSVVMTVLGKRLARSPDDQMDLLDLIKETLGFDDEEADDKKGQPEKKDEKKKGK